MLLKFYLYAPHSPVRRPGQTCSTTGKRSLCIERPPVWHHPIIANPSIYLSTSRFIFYSLKTSIITLFVLIPLLIRGTPQQYIVSISHRLFYSFCFFPPSLWFRVVTDTMSYYQFKLKLSSLFCP